MESSSNENLSSLYPPPPFFYKFFTKENLNRLKEWKKSNNKDKNELGYSIFLLPPEIPEGEYYMGYGNRWFFENNLPTLESGNWKQLYKDEDFLLSEKKIEILHKLVDSLLLNYLELITIASVDGSQMGAKIHDFSVVVMNINHILNTYRPHQTRESLILLLRNQIKKKKNDIDKIEKTIRKYSKRMIEIFDVEDLKTKLYHFQEQEDDKNIHK